MEDKLLATDRVRNFCIGVLGLDKVAGWGLDDQQLALDIGKILHITAKEQDLKSRADTQREIREYLSDLIIGIEGCEFGERFDDDKGCIVLDMNMNQWNDYWGIENKETQCLKCEEGISLQEHAANIGLCNECHRKAQFRMACEPGSKRR